MCWINSADAVSIEHMQQRPHAIAAAATMQLRAMFNIRNRLLKHLDFDSSVAVMSQLPAARPGRGYVLYLSFVTAFQGQQGYCFIIST